MASGAAVPAAGSTEGEDPGTVGGAGTPPTAPRLLEFRGFDRSGPGHGRSVNVGDALCHKPRGSCGLVTVQLTARWDELHGGAGAAARRVRMVVIGRARLAVPAQGRRRVRVTLPAGVRRMLAGGEVLHAVVAVRAAGNRLPIVHRIALRRG
jgi:hypothetical protein